MYITAKIMKNSTLKLAWILVIVSSTFLPAVTLNQERVYAQDSPNVTNATVLSGDDDANSQSGLQNQSINYFDGSSGSVNLSKSPPYYNNQQIGETSLQHALVYICSYYMENNHQNSQFYL